MATRARLLALGLVVAVALTGCQSSEGGGEGGGGESACPAAVEIDGVTYNGAGPTRRTPATTGDTLVAVLPGCDDSGGQDDAVEAEQIEVEVLTDVDPDLAVLWHESIYVRDGRALPASTRAWFTAPRCTTEGPFNLVADWLGVMGPKKPRFDGDLRLPYRLEVRVTEGPSRYVGATLTLRAGRATDPALSPADVKASLWEGGRVTASVTCRGGRFDVLGVTASGPTVTQQSPSR